MSFCVYNLNGNVRSCAGSYDGGSGTLPILFRFCPPCGACMRHNPATAPMQMTMLHASRTGFADTCTIAGLVVGCISVASVMICSPVCGSDLAVSNLVKRESLVVCCTDRRFPAIVCNSTLGRGVELLPGRCCVASIWMLWLCVGFVASSIVEGAQKKGVPTSIVMSFTCTTSNAYSAARLTNTNVSILAMYAWPSGMTAVSHSLRLILLLRVAEDANCDMAGAAAEHRSAPLPTRN